MSRFLVVLGLMAASVVGVAQSSQTELPWLLRKAIKEGPGLKYTGTRTIEFRRDGQTQRHTEMLTRDGSRLRVEFPPGSKYAGQIIVETNKERRHFFPDKNEIRVMPPRREEAMHRLARLGASNKYVLKSASGENVAGISTKQVIVSDLSGNVVQRLFIDPHSGVLLKRQIFDAVGTQVGLFEFDRITLNPRLSDDLFRLERRGAKVIRPEDILRGIAREGGYVFGFVKPTSGFHLEFSRTTKIEGREVISQFYSSGNGRLSLFQFKQDAGSQQLSRLGRGDVHIYSWKARGNTFVLVGNQDQATLKRIAAHMTFGN